MKTFLVKRTYRIQAGSKQGAIMKLNRAIIDRREYQYCIYETVQVSQSSNEVIKWLKEFTGQLFGRKRLE